MTEKPKADLMVERPPTLRVRVIAGNKACDTWAQIDTGASICCLRKDLAEGLDLCTAESRVYSGLQGPVRAPLLRGFQIVLLPPDTESGDTKAVGNALLNIERGSLGIELKDAGA